LHFELFLFHFLLHLLHALVMISPHG
jgi:hypothetical protein